MSRYEAANRTVRGGMELVRWHMSTPGVREWLVNETRRARREAWGTRIILFAGFPAALSVAGAARALGCTDTAGQAGVLAIILVCVGVLGLLDDRKQARRLRALADHPEVLLTSTGVSFGGRAIPWRSKRRWLNVAYLTSEDPAVLELQFVHKRMLRQDRYESIRIPIPRDTEIDIAEVAEVVSRIGSPKPATQLSGR